jgi:hypothetical protein
MDQEVKCFQRKLHRLCLRPRVHQIPGTPQMLTHQGQTIREGRLRFAIPCRLLDGDTARSAHPQGQHRDEREQAQQDGGGAGNRLLRDHCRCVSNPR